MHDAVFKKNVFAVDGPDGEHDLEDVVSCSYFHILQYSSSYECDEAIV